jgi:SAM-dependent methyltransferase
MSSVATASDQELWDLERLAQARGLGDWMFDQVRAGIGPNVVEVGAGIGTFTERILEEGAERVLAIEPEPVCVGTLERRFAADPRVEVACELLPEAPALSASAGTADLVLCQNVLEHIEDDAAAVRAMAGALRPGGTLALLVPAHPRLYGTLDRQYGHYRRYDRARVVEVIAGSGLHLDRLYSFNLLGVAGWVVKNRMSEPSLDSRSLGVYEQLLKLWRPIEDRLELPWGLSLIAHARRL